MRPILRTSGGVLAALVLAALWAQAPAPENAPQVVALPAARAEGGFALDRALSARRAVRAFQDRPADVAQLSSILWAAQGVTGQGGRRTAPSAGATYPLEIHVAAGRVSGLAPGLYRYSPQGHSLARERAGDPRKDLVGAALRQGWVARAPAILVFSGVEARTAGRYGERAGRYVAIEAGCAAQNAALEAVAQGLGTCFVGAFDDAAVRKVLDLPQGEAPLLLLPVGAPAAG